LPLHLHIAHFMAGVLGSWRHDWCDFWCLRRNAGWHRSSLLSIRGSERGLRGCAAVMVLPERRGRKQTENQGVDECGLAVPTPGTAPEM
jgi:hypothetical protein